MHECINCGDTCDCDQEDTWYDDPEYCDHECEDYDEDEDW